MRNGRRKKKDKRDKNKHIRRTEHTVRTANEVSEAPIWVFLGSVAGIIKRCNRKFTKSHHGAILKPDS